MSWKTFHNRGEILRSVVDLANERRDGILPMDAPGVAENFHDELDLIGALLLRWHARLSGNIERTMMREPMDLESAVAAAWRTTAEQMPGVRMVIDRCLEAPQGAEMEQVMRRARDHEWARLATAAGLANTQDAAAVEVGRRVEEQARVALAVSLVLADVEPTGEAAVEPAGSGPGSTSFVDRIKAVIAA